jgi:hypothetical protein
MNQPDQKTLKAIAAENFPRRALQEFRNEEMSTIKTCYHNPMSKEQDKQESAIPGWNTDGSKRKPAALAAEYQRGVRDGRVGYVPVTQLAAAVEALKRLKEWHSENGEPRRIIDAALAKIREEK